MMNTAKPFVRITITDMPPSTNGLRKSFIKDGKVFSAKSETYSSWLKAAMWEVAAQRPGKVSGRRFIQGEVADHKAGRLPTVAEFAKECRSAHAELDARDWARNRKALPAPEQGPAMSEEHRAKMLSLISTWKRAWAGDRQARRDLEPWGWKP